MRFTLLLLFTFAFHAHAATSSLNQMLAGKSWCFQDKEGPRAFGRLHFDVDGRGQFDVFDAPGGGFIPFVWSAWENQADKAVFLNFERGFDPLEQSADVTVVDRETLLWSWTVESGGTISLLRKCSM